MIDTTRAVRTALRLLNKVGAEYRIFTPDGTRIYSHPRPMVRQNRPAPKSLVNFAASGYIERMRTLQPGQTVSLTIPEPELTLRFSNAVQCAGRRHFGPRNFLTRAYPKQGRVDVMRIA